MCHNNHCPTPTKRRHPTYEQAINAMHRAWRRHRGGNLPTRAYRCQCGAWHLTHLPLDEYTQHCA